MACDMLGSYGPTRRYTSLERIKKVNNKVIIGASGNYSDFRYIIKIIDDLLTNDFCESDGLILTPYQVYMCLFRVMYNRRNSFDPLWNSLVIAGFHQQKTFIGLINMLGTHFTNDYVVIGIANHIVRPYFKESY